MPFLLEDKLKERGAHYEGAPPWQKKVVVSDRLVTGQNPASAAGVAEAIVQVLQPIPTVSGAPVRESAAPNKKIP